MGRVALAWVVSIAVVLVGCGDDDCCSVREDASAAIEDAAADGVLADAPGPDAFVEDPSGTCNPLTQAGCAPGRKCTWLLDALSPQYVGHVGCAPAGAAGVGEVCMYGAPGASGYDNCAAGLVCGNYRGGTGVCKTICDQQGGQPACASTHACVTYSGLFTTGPTTPQAGGVCDLACDPLADNDFDGSGSISAKTGTICGSAASVGCYGYPSFGTPPVTGWTCTNDINFDTAQATGGLRHRVPCTDANSCTEFGSYYINSCNQGYLPLLYEQTGSSTVVCVAMCRPQPCYAGNCGTGTPPVGATGNRDGQQPHECSGASRIPAANFASTEHCLHLWSWEMSDSNTLLPSPTSDTVGFCLDQAKYQYASTAGGQPDTTFPNCDQLQLEGTGAAADRANPTVYFGAVDFGCVPTTMIPPAARGKAQLPPSVLERRKLLDLPRPLYRRTAMP